MRVRSVEEVQKEINESYSEYKEYKEYAGLYFDKGSRCYKWRNPEYISKMNDITHHIRNLKLELNRAKIKEWEIRAGIQKRK